MREPSTYSPGHAVLDRDGGLGGLLPVGLYSADSQYSWETVVVGKEGRSQWKDPRYEVIRADLPATLTLTWQDSGLLTAVCPRGVTNREEVGSIMNAKPLRTRTPQ